MNKIKVILTGATGMAGEGVLLECLRNEKVERVLVVGRRPCGISHRKLKELLVPDFFRIDEAADQLSGYDGCFFCAGISSIGMKEAEYTRITYDTTLHFARAVLEKNPQLVFDYISGSSTDSTEKGSLMWARVKGKTENDLMKMPFKGAYNFRPGVMTPFKEQKNVKRFLKILIGIFPLLFPKSVLSLSQVGRAMIKTVTDGYSKHILEIKDIKILAE